MWVVGLFPSTVVVFLVGYCPDLTQVVMLVVITRAIVTVLGVLVWVVLLCDKTGIFWYW